MFGQQNNTPFSSAPSRPFGAPAPAPFGSPAPAPFGGGGFGAPAPAPSAFGGGGGFGAPPAPSAFGAPAPAPSAFGGGGGFGAPPAPGGFGAAPNSSPFGAPPAAAPSGGLFGAPAPAPSGGLFGSTANAGGFGAPSTGGFGGGFGAPAPAPFGGNPGGGAFGAPAAAPSGGMFGSTAPAAPSAFGAASTFGSPAPAPSGGMFAAAAPAAGGMFGAPTTAPGQGGGSKMVPFTVTTRQDGNSSTNISFQSITAMQPYENKSFEELRFEDYSMGNKGDGSGNSGAPGGFGAPAAFGAPAPAAGGLFGAQAAPAFGAVPAPAFGAAPTQFGSPPAAAGFGAAPAGFGAAPAPAFGAAPASAFGAAPAPAFGGFGAKPAAGGMFGAPAPAPGLFGAPAPAPGGGLFGSAPAAPAFGSPAPAPGGLFGAPAPAPGGLFGAPAPAPGGLFGAPAPAPAGGGLFGAPAPVGGGLFGAQAPAPAFGAAPPLGGGMFGAPAPAPGGMFGAKPAGGLFGAPAAGAPYGSSAPAQSMGLYGGQAPAAQAPSYTMGAPANIIPPAADAALQQQLAAISNQRKELEKLEVWRGNSSSGSTIVPTSLAASDVLKVSPYSESAPSSYRASPKSSTKIRPRGFGTPTVSSPMVSSSFGRSGTPVRMPSAIAASSAKRLTINPGTHTPKPSLRLQLSNGGAQNASPLPLCVAAAKSPSPVRMDVTSPQATVRSPPTFAMKDGGPTGSGKKPPTPTDTAHDFYNQIVGSPNATTPRSNISYLPTLTKLGYKTVPSLSEMANMSEADLAALQGFKVTREGFGSVEWEGTVDVRGIDLDSIVTIELQDVAVYEDQESAGTKPREGEKLNRPAVISFAKTFPRKGGANASTEVKEKYASKLEKTTAAMGADFVGYNRNQGIWQFRVHHFSRYGLYDDSDDEEEPSAASKALQHFDSGERGGRSLELKKGSPTRFTVPQDDDDVAMGEDQMDEDVVLISDSERMDSYQIQNSAQEAYKTMFLSPRAERLTPVVVEEEEDVFPDESQFAYPPPQPIVSPPHGSEMILNRGSSICARIMSQSGIAASSVATGLGMGRTFRVGWRPDGSFLHLKSGSVLIQSRPIFSESSSTSTCVRLLNAHKKHAEMSEAQGFALTNASSGDLSDAVNESISAIRTGGDDCTSDLALTQAFALLECLLNTKDKSIVGVPILNMAGNESMQPALNKKQTMEAFRRWLKNSCTSTVRIEIASAQQRGDFQAAIFAALTAGDTPQAAAIATENGYLQLAAMITSGSSSSDFIREQVRQWHETGASTMISTTLMRVYTLLGGDLSLEERFYRNGDSSCDWMRRLGLLLTYGSDEGGGDYNFTTLVKKYDASVAAGVAPEPEPLYARDGMVYAAGSKSLLYSVIRLFDAVANGHQGQISLLAVVQPLCHTPAPHDFSGSFQLASILSVLECCAPLTELEQARLLNGYASQLICAGKWEFAVYVMLSSVGLTSLRWWRMQQAKRIVLQNYMTESKTKDNFLTEKIRVPKAWLHEGLADRAANNGDLFEYIRQLSSISQDGTREALEESLVPNILFQNPEEASKSMDLASMFCTDSGSLTGTVLHLHDLSQDIKEISDEPIEAQDAQFQELKSKADSIEISLLRHKASLENLKSPSIARTGQTVVPMTNFLAESLSGLSFLKLQLHALEAGSSIWDEGITNAPMKLPSQLVAESTTNDKVMVKAAALKGYL